jgi:EmrB/QacA subfamily drug resistance transporter
VLSLRSREGRWVVAATVLGSGVAALGATVVNIALPAIGRDLDADLADLQWVTTSYVLTLSAFLLLGGALGDRYGRRRVFVIGVVWFAVASALCAIAPSAGFLIAARAVQGIGAALLTPGSLAILQASFVPEDRSKAIGAWSGLGGLATAGGPVLGGWLIDVASWRWVFLVNLPMVAATVWITARHVPESRDEARASRGGRLDVGGAALAVVWLGALALALIGAPARGWTSTATLGLVAVTVTAFGAFIVVERRAADPMLPLEMFAEARFSSINAVTFVVYGALTGALFLLPIALQVGGGYSPLAAGVATLPITVIMLVGSAPSGALATRIGPKLQLTAGPVLVGLGLFMLRDAGGGSYASTVLPGLVVHGIGLALTVAPLTAVALDAAPAEHAGVASAVNNDVARAAGLIAVAVLPGIVGLDATSFTTGEGLADGFRLAMVLSAIGCAAGGLLAALTIENRRPPVEPEVPAFHCAVEGPPPCASRPADELLVRPSGSRSP